MRRRGFTLIELLVVIAIIASNSIRVKPRERRIMILLMAILA